MRSLGAIFMADIVGYSKMISSDERGTLSALRLFSAEMLEPNLKKYGGNLIKAMGDGWLIEFKSATNAVQCALDLQKQLKTQDRLSLRVGIHIGDVEHEGGDVFGDTVNVAARLETVAESGDVAISSSTYLCLDQLIAEPFKNCGKQTLKNISTPIEVWSTGRINEGASGLVRTRTGDNPVIAIVPFEFSDQRFVDFSGSLAADLERELSSKAWLDSIIQRNPANDDFKLIGSVEEVRGRVVITATLFAPGGTSLWSGEFAGNANQINSISTSLAQQISNQLFIEIMKVRNKYK